MSYEITSSKVDLTCNDDRIFSPRIHEEKAGTMCILASIILGVTIFLPESGRNRDGKGLTADQGIEQRITHLIYHHDQDSDSDAQLPVDSTIARPEGKSRMFSFSYPGNMAV
jgi:hypothetical protein